MRAIAVCALCLLLGSVATADSANPLTKRVRSLERRMNAVATLVVESDQLDTEAVAIPMTHYGQGFYKGTAFCPEGMRATGGGINFGDALQTNDQVFSSYRDTKFSWTASVNSYGSLPFVQVVCADLR